MLCNVKLTVNLKKLECQVTTCSILTLFGLLWTKESNGALYHIGLHERSVSFGSQQWYGGEIKRATALWRTDGPSEAAGRVCSKTPKSGQNLSNMDHPCDHTQTKELARKRKIQLETETEAQRKPTQVPTNCPCEPADFDEFWQFMCSVRALLLEINQLWIEQNHVCIDFSNSDQNKHNGPGTVTDG